KNASDPDPNSILRWEHKSDIGSSISAADGAITIVRSSLWTPGRVCRFRSVELQASPQQVPPALIGCGKRRALVPSWAPTLQSSGGSRILDALGDLCDWPASDPAYMELYRKLPPSPEPPVAPESAKERKSFNRMMKKAIQPPMNADERG